MATKIKFPVNIAVLSILPIYTLYEGGSLYEVLSSLLFSLIIIIPVFIIYLIGIGRDDILYKLFHKKKRTGSAYRANQNNWSEQNFNESTESESNSSSYKGSGSSKQSKSSYGSNNSSSNSQKQNNDRTSYSSNNDQNMTFAKAVRLLKINNEFTFRELKSNYRKLLIENHPDKFVNSGKKNQERAEQITIKLIQAYEYLKQFAKEVEHA